MTNFAYLTGDYSSTPPELVGMYPLGNGGVLEAPYRHYFEAKHLKKLVPLAKTMNVLELGSGNGRWAKEFSPKVEHYTGVDLTPEAIAIAREVLVKEGIKNADFQEMPLTDFAGDRPYSFIYFSGVTQFLQDEELDGFLRKIEPWFTDNLVIVDRSTLNHRARSITDRPTYFSIYRHPDELDRVFKSRGFTRSYRKRSYRYMRGAAWLRRHPRIEGVLKSLVPATAPFSLYVMYAWSFCADLFGPSRSAEPDLSHDFSVFTRKP